MKIELQPYEERVASGLLVRKTEGDLVLYNYTEKCQFDRLWDEYTLTARGLIVTIDGVVVARPFPKFFNLGESHCPPLPDAPYIAFEKIDGSLGIWYHYEGQWRVATRGSLGNQFTDYARDYAHFLASFPRNWTVLTEICMPRELDGMVRAVNHHPGLYLLGAVNRIGGDDIDPTQIQAGWRGLLAESWHKSIDQLLADAEGSTGAEGWVLRFANGLRVKIKTAWYMRLFRAISHLTEKHVKELAADGGIGWLAEFPEEIRPEAEAIYAGILARYNERLGIITAAFEQFNCPDRKTFALSVKDHPERPYLFLLYDNREITKKLLLDC